MSKASLLEQGMLPVAELARIGLREGWRPPQTYQAHRWFARRLSSAVRSLLVGAKVANLRDFWRGYRDGVDYNGVRLLDPFVGGGTSIIEAHRLGATTTGVDVDAVSCAITAFEARAHAVPDLRTPLEDLRRRVGKRLRHYYVTTDRGRERVVLHAFWVQRVRCGGCDRTIDAHPHYQLGYEAEGRHQWVFCPDCRKISRIDRTAIRHRCTCGRSFAILAGVVEKGILKCPRCGHLEPLITVGRRTKKPPQWYLFALETVAASERSVTPLARRTFQRATDADRRIYRAAQDALSRHLKKTGFVLPSRRIPVKGRSDNRLLAYGYTDYLQLFNARQLLHLCLLAEAIADQPANVREALVIAFSDHLTTNCMMTSYAFGWRRLAPLFSIRAYRHVPRPVELNPWSEAGGRGTYPNAVRQVDRCVQSARAVVNYQDRRPRAIPLKRAHIVQGDSRELARYAVGAFDLVLTDPPYFDNIAYSELSDFFVPWLRHFGLIRSRSAAIWGRRDSIAATSRGPQAAAEYTKALRLCFAQMAKVLTVQGRVVFTYQHSTARAWKALADALADQPLRVLQVFPILGNSPAGPHVGPGTCRWDAVFVLGQQSRAGQRHGTRGSVIAAATRHWAARTSVLARGRRVKFGKADRLGYFRACMAAGAGGMFGVPDASVLNALQTAMARPADALERIVGSASAFGTRL